MRTSEADLLRIAVRWSLHSSLAELERAVRAEHFVLFGDRLDGIFILPTTGPLNPRTRYSAAVRRKADEIMNSYTPVDPAIEEYEKNGTGRLAITLEEALARKLGQRWRGRPRKLAG